MNTQEAAALLAVAAAFDNRKPDADAATAWGIALAEFPFIMCRDAVVAHYRKSREWIMPSDVIAGVKRIAVELMRPFGTLIPPASIQGELEDEMRWQLWARDEIMSGRATRPADIGMDDVSGYPVRDLSELGFATNEPRRLANPDHIAKVRAGRAVPDDAEAST